MDVSFTGILSHVEGMVKGGMESGTYTAADLCFSLQVIAAASALAVIVFSAGVGDGLVVVVVDGDSAVGGGGIIGVVGVAAVVVSESVVRQRPQASTHKGERDVDLLPGVFSYLSFRSRGASIVVLVFIAF